MDSFNQIAIYKPNGKGTGSAAQFKIAKDKGCMFLEIAKQVADSKDQKFDWSKKMVVKLGDTDITKMLALFNGTAPVQTDANKPDLQLFHENAKGNKIITLKRQTNPMYPGYYMTVSVSEGEIKERVSMPISPDETEYLKIGMTRAIQCLLGW